MIRFLWDCVKRSRTSIALMIVAAFVGNLLVSSQPILISSVLDLLSPGKTISAPSMPAEPPRPGLKTIDLQALGKATVQRLSDALTRPEDPPEKRSFRIIAALAALFALVGVLGAVLNFLAILIGRQIKASVAARLRGDLMAHLLRLGVSYHQRERSGEILSRVLVDANNVANGVGPLIRSAVHQSLLTCVYGYYLLSTNLTLFLISLGVMSAHVGLAALMRRRVRGSTGGLLTATASVSAEVQDSLSTVRLIQSYGAEPFAMGRIRGMLDRLARSEVREGTISEGEPAVRNVIDVFAMATILIVASWQLLSGQLTFEAFLLFVLVGRMIIPPINGCAVVFSWSQAMSAAYERIHTILSTPTPIASGRSSVPKLRHELHLSGVSFRYPGEGGRVFEGLELRIPAGRTTLIAGPSGVGKSTLLDLVLRIQDAQSGSIRWDGLDIRDFQLAEYRRQFGVVPQDPLIFNDTLRENIRLGRSELGEAEIQAALKLADAESFVRAMPEGLDTVALERGGRLSGGQKQRISIARAVACDPQILILDEATSALDAQSEAEVSHALRSASRGRTVLLVTHRLAQAPLADSILFLDPSEGALTGTHTELMARSQSYRTLYESQPRRT